MSTLNNPKSLAGLSALLLLAGLTMLWGAGCGSSHQLSNMWKDPEYSRAPMKHVFVIAMKRDAAIRRLWEDDFVRALQERGIAADPSYRYYPKMFPDTSEVIRAVRENGYDGVIVTTKLSDRTKAEFVPGYVHIEPVTGFNPWVNMFYTHYVEVYSPGYTETSTVVRYHTDVWSTLSPDGGMIWTGTSEVIDPSSSEQVRHYVTDMVVPELARQAIIS